MRSVALSLGHWGKTSRPRDRGATSDGLVEARVALKFLVACATAYERSGVRAWLLTHGDYAERARYADARGVGLFLAFHMNSATRPGDYGMVICDARGRNEARAEATAEAMSGVLGWRFVTEGRGKGDRGFNNFAHVHAPAFILEPGFINNERHVAALTDESVLDTLASALVAATTGAA